MCFSGLSAQCIELGFGKFHGHVCPGDPGFWDTVHSGRLPSLYTMIQSRALSMRLLFKSIIFIIFQYYIRTFNLK